MNALLKDIIKLWQVKVWFKVATIYLLLLLILVLVLDWLPFHFSPNQLDLINLSKAPLEAQNKHWAGTDALGRDVLVNTLYGARTGLAIALPVMFFSSILGTVIGASAGYFGNTKLKTTIGKWLVVTFMICSFYFYGLYIPLKLMLLEFGIEPVFYSLFILTVLLLFLWFLLLPQIQRLHFFRKRFELPFDKMVLRIIEILTSIPKLILILTLASFITPSVTLLSTILIFTYWTGTARLARAEMLRIKQLPFIEAAQSLGLPHTSIIWKEALPNLLGPVVVTFTFGVAGLLAVEATLSFLGIGLPASTPSWGRLISGIRSDTAAWWLVVIPGTFLTLTVLAFQICSHYLLNSLQEKRNF